MMKMYTTTKLPYNMPFRTKFNDTSESVQYINAMD